MGFNVGTVSRIGDRLKEVLPSARGEQKALAHRAGLTPETLNRVLTGATKEPGFETIAKICRAAGLDVNRLIAETTSEPQVVASMAAEMIQLPDRRRFQELADWLASRFGVVARDGINPTFISGAAYNTALSENTEMPPLTGMLLTEPDAEERSSPIPELRRGTPSAEEKPKP